MTAEMVPLRLVPQEKCFIQHLPYPALPDVHTTASHSQQPLKSTAWEASFRVLAASNTPWLLTRALARSA